jgi:hypothetical protein
MQPDDFIHQIQQKDFPLQHFVQLAMTDQNVREMLVQQMVHHAHIMVYFQCFYVLEKAVPQQPALFYAYWPQIVPLLEHPNSYHRGFALVLLPHMIPPGEADAFIPLFERYFSHLQDEKFMTAHHCILGSRTLVLNRPALHERIVQVLLESDQNCPYPPKQKALLQASILEVVAVCYATLADPQPAKTFILACQQSLSPKTRKLARQYTAALSLSGA